MAVADGGVMPPDASGDSVSALFTAKTAALLFVLTTLVFLSTWLLLANGTQPYFLRRAPLFSVVLPVLTAQAVIACVVAAITVACMRMPPAVRKRCMVIGFFIAYAFAVIAVIRYLQMLAPIAVPQGVTAGINVSFVSLFAVSIFRAERAARVLRQFTWLASTLVALILVRALWFACVPPPAAYGDRSPGLNRSSAAVARRVVIIIFDEMSQQIAFGNRPPSLQLPNFDALRARSVYATAAYSPSNRTSVSLPAITTGFPVASVDFSGPAQARIRFVNAPAADWSGTDTIFDDAKRSGGNIGIAGWYHPYARVLASKATDVTWYPGQVGIEGMPGTAPGPFLLAVTTMLRDHLLAFPYLGRLFDREKTEWARTEHLRCAEFVLQQGARLMRDPSFSLVFLHLPVPHPLPVYDRAHGQFRTAGTGSYVDNVALADRFLGDLLQVLKSSGLDSNTTVIATADHSWRVLVWRNSATWTAEEEQLSKNVDYFSVPFIVCLPGNQAGVTYDRRVSVLATRGMVKRILSGEISRPDQVTSYLSSFNNPPPVLVPWF
jgi:hypothetical protein